MAFDSMRPHASPSSQYTARSFDEDESAAGPSGGVAPAGAAQDQRHRPAQPMLLLHQAVAIMAAASQVAITVSQWSRATSSTGQALTGLLAIGLVCAAVGTVRWPHTYWRNRCACHALLFIFCARTALQCSGVCASAC